MLFKDLKEIVEAEEPKLDADGNPIEAPEKEAPVKTTKQKEISKETADGVGNEPHDIALKVSEFLDSVLSQSYKVGDVEAEKSMVIIHGAGKFMDTNTEEFVNAVQQYITASIGVEGLDNFDIAGPFKAGNNVNIVFTDKK